MALWIRSWCLPAFFPFTRLSVFSFSCHLLPAWPACPFSLSLPFSSMFRSNWKAPFCATVNHQAVLTLAAAAAAASSSPAVSSSSILGVAVLEVAIAGQEQCNSTSRHHSVEANEHSFLCLLWCCFRASSPSPSPSSFPSLCAHLFAHSGHLRRALLITARAAALLFKYDSSCDLSNPNLVGKFSSHGQWIACLLEIITWKKSATKSLCLTVPFSCTSSCHCPIGVSWLWWMLVLLGQRL